MDSQIEQPELDYEPSRSILKNSFNDNSEQSNHNPLKPSSHVMFVDRAQNLPLYTLHEVEKLEYQPEQTEKATGSCACTLL